MLKKFSYVTVVLLLLASIFACEPPDDETVAKVITSATTVAFSQILAKNPQIEDQLYMYAIFQRQAIVEKTVNAELADKIFKSIIESCKDLDENDKQQMITLFSTILPMIEIPPEGTLSPRTEKFMVAFLDGIISVVETRKAIDGCECPEIPSTDGRVQLLMETLDGLHSSIT